VWAAREGELSAAREALKANHPGEAVQRLDGLAQAFPDDAEVLGTLAVAYAQQGDARRAAALLNSAGRAAPIDGGALSRLLESMPSHTPLRDAVAGVLRARPDTPGELSAIETLGGLGLRVQLQGNLRFSPWPKAKGAPPYVVSPGYFSPEWIPPLDQSLQQLPGVAVPESLLRNSPLVIENPVTGQRLWRTGLPPGR
jgi:hypothetical protein